MAEKHQRINVIFLIIPIILVACSPSIHGQATLAPPKPPTGSTNRESPLPPTMPIPSSQSDSFTLTENQAVIGFTYHTPFGNRFIAGKGNLPLQTPVNIDLPGKPIWINGAPSGKDSAWTVVLEDGEVINILAGEDGIENLDILPMSLPPGMPPSVRSMSGDYSLVTVSDQDQSTTTHPIYLPKSKLRVHITQTGEIQFTDPEDKTVATLSVNALPDARILFDEQERILLLTDPTDRYSHAVLGDNLEAGSITLIETQPLPRIESAISLPDNEVVEGIAPIWVDINGDKQREIIVTVSDLDLGAGIVIFSETGERLAEGPKMGRAFRWRHQIGYLNLGPEDENELVVVRTPHIGGVVEYYQYSNGNLTITAEFAGITSHTLGSRNLDMAALGDFDGDGVNELLLLLNLSELVAVRRTPSGAEQVWRLPIGGVMSTNLSGVTLSNGEIAIAVGREDGVFTLWLPQ